MKVAVPLRVRTIDESGSPGLNERGLALLDYAGVALDSRRATWFDDRDL
jgi:hypothetical protein